jgi:G3E family GTPase
MGEIKLDIISGFLGAGKTTLINKLLREAWQGEKVAVLENEFGEIGVDGDLLGGADLTVKEITNGCICCTLKVDFVDGIKTLVHDYSPDRIVIEPTGIGKLADIPDACRLAAREVPVSVQTIMTVAQASLVFAFLEVSGEFYQEQIQNAPIIVLSAVQELSADDPPLSGTLDRIREIKPRAAIFSEPWDDMDSLKLLAVAEELTGNALKTGSWSLDPADHGAGHDHGNSHEAGHAHHHDDHDHVLENGGFDSCSFLLKEAWTREAVENLAALIKDGSFGLIFRAKGFFPVQGRLHKMDYVYGRLSLTPLAAALEGKFVITGKEIKKEALSRYMASPMTTQGGRPLP